MYYFGAARLEKMMTFGSFATEIRESCQVRNEAALSGSFRVPGGCLDRVGSLRKRPGYEFEVMRTVFVLCIIKKKIYFVAGDDPGFFCCNNFWIIVLATLS